MVAVSREIREDVVEVLVRYASAIDQRDWELLRTCFTPDCVAEYGQFGVWRSSEELVRYMERAHEPFGALLHRITNQVVRQDGDGIAARSYVDAILMSGDGTALRLVGYYDDELTNGPGGWRIAHRRFTPVLSERGILDHNPKEGGV
jgi:hypothetical protein